VKPAIHSVLGVQNKADKEVGSVNRGDDRPSMIPGEKCESMCSTDRTAMQSSQWQGHAGMNLKLNLPERAWPQKCPIWAAAYHHPYGNLWLVQCFKTFVIIVRIERVQQDGENK
jgi:hypothetical protein